MPFSSSQRRWQKDIPTYQITAIYFQPARTHYVIGYGINVVVRDGAFFLVDPPLKLGMLKN